MNEPKKREAPIPFRIPKSNKQLIKKFAVAAKKKGATYVIIEALNNYFSITN